MNPIDNISPATLKMELKEYFGLPQRGWSRYLRRLDYQPGILSEQAPKQLHKTARHSRGGYVALSQGKPDLKDSVLSMLEASIRYEVMVGAMEYLKTHDWDRWRALNEMTRRSPLKRAKDIAGELSVGPPELNKQVNAAIRAIADYLDWYYLNEGA